VRHVIGDALGKLIVVRMAGIALLSVLMYVEGIAVCPQIDSVAATIASELYA
jgi:hypothetical protein